MQVYILFTTPEPFASNGSLLSVYTSREKALEAAQQDEGDTTLHFSEEDDTSIVDDDLCERYYISIRQLDEKLSN